MTTEVVQFREDKVELDFLRAKGINPNQLAREAFEGAKRHVRAQDKFEKLSRLRIRLPKPAAELIREDRDSH